MLDRRRSRIDWIDIVSLLFIVGLALLPPIYEIHKQVILFAFAVLQFFESRFISLLGSRGQMYSVALKIALASLLLDHTGEVAINSGYWPIYYLPIVTAAI